MQCWSTNRLYELVVFTFNQRHQQSSRLHATQTSAASFIIMSVCFETNLFGGIFILLRSLEKVFRIYGGSCNFSQHDYSPRDASSAFFNKGRSFLRWSTTQCDWYFIYQVFVWNVVPFIMCTITFQISSYSRIKTTSIKKVSIQSALDHQSDLIDSIRVYTTKIANDTMMTRLQLQN